MNDDDILDYGQLIDEAMHFVVRKAITLVQKHGLDGEHHFFITFSTDFPGVMISDDLKSKYPEEMTIVIQHQYWDLEVEDDCFSIVLSFGQVKHSLRVPFASLISFADPSVKFGLQFQYDLDVELELGEDARLLPSDGDGKPVIKGAANNVVALDSFRKK